MPMSNLYLNQLHATSTRENLHSVPECAFRTYSLYYTEKIPFVQLHGCLAIILQICKITMTNWNN